MKKIINILLIIIVISTFVVTACGSSKKSKDEITWKDAMEKYQELTQKRDDVIKLMQEKSKK